MRDTIDMAREAGLQKESRGWSAWTKDLKAFEALVRADERNVEQEPVATLIDHYGFTDGVVRFDGVENMEQLPIGTKFYIAPLNVATPLDETSSLAAKEEIQRLRALVRALQITIDKLESKLKEKNSD